MAFLFLKIFMFQLDTVTFTEITPAMPALKYLNIVSYVKI